MVTRRVGVGSATATATATGAGGAGAAAGSPRSPFPTSCCTSTGCPIRSRTSSSPLPWRRERAASAATRPRARSGKVSPTIWASSPTTSSRAAASRRVKVRTSARGATASTSLVGAGHGDDQVGLRGVSLGELPHPEVAGLGIVAGEDEGAVGVHGRADDRPGAGAGHPDVRRRTVQASSRTARPRRSARAERQMFPVQTSRTEKSWGGPPGSLTGTSCGQ